MTEPINNYIKRYANTNDLKVIIAAKDLCVYINQTCLNAPKVQRFNFVKRLNDLAFDTLESLFRANEFFVKAGNAQAIQRRYNFQHKALVNIRLIIYQAEMASNVKCITRHQFGVISKRAIEVITLIGAWINSDEKRFGKPASKI